MRAARPGRPSPATPALASSGTAAAVRGGREASANTAPHTHSARPLCVSERDAVERRLHAIPDKQENQPQRERCFSATRRRPLCQPALDGAAAPSSAAFLRKILCEMFAAGNRRLLANAPSHLSRSFARNLQIFFPIFRRPNEPNRPRGERIPAGGGSLASISATGISLTFFMGQRHFVRHENTVSIYASRWSEKCDS